MSKDKIEVNMNVYDIPILVEALEEANKEIERLKKLCDKYEEEHKTTFEEWKKTINIIKEVREYILTHKLYCFEYDEEELFEIVTDKKAKDELLEILDKENK